MEIFKTQNGDTTVFTLSGKLNTTTAPKLQEALMPEIQAAKNVDLDFAGVENISSAGLRILLMGESTAKAKGVKQTLRNVSKIIMDVFEITGFSAILNIE